MEPRQRATETPRLAPHAPPGGILLRLGPRRPQAQQKTPTPVPLITSAPIAVGVPFNYTTTAPTPNPNDLPPKAAAGTGDHY